VSALLQLKMEMPSTASSVVKSLVSPRSFLTSLSVPHSDQDTSDTHSEVNNNATCTHNHHNNNHAIPSSVISAVGTGCTNWISNGSLTKHLTVPTRKISGSGQSCNQKSRTPDSKLVVLGNPAVGKSALVVRFLTRRFIWEYDPTLECIHRYLGLVDDEQICIDILDTAGQGDSSYQDGNIKWGEGFLLVYSITDRASFEELQHLHHTIGAIRCSQNTAFILVGNKSDMTHERQVSYAEGEQLAADLGCAFFEVSACDGDREMYEAFWEVHREVVRRRLAMGRRRRSSAQQVIQVLNKMFTKING